MNVKTVGILLAGAGLVVIFAGSELAGVGQSIDNLVASKWTGVAMVASGLVMFGGLTKAASAL